MKLAELVLKNDFHDVATATFATFATLDPAFAPIVAKVAKVAVANPENQKTRLPEMDVMTGCPEQEKTTRPEWIAAVCACRFRDCTMWMKDKRPLECLWAGDGVTKSEEVLQ